MYARTQGSPIEAPTVGFRDRQEPKNIKDVRVFIKFTNFYYQFINNFSALVLPLIALTQKDKAFIFNKECKKAFTYLKVIFTTTLIL